jgi:hypothetical protein
MEDILGVRQVRFAKAPVHAEGARLARARTCSESERTGG